MSVMCGIGSVKVLHHKIFQKGGQVIAKLFSGSKCIIVLPRFLFYTL